MSTGLWPAVLAAVLGHHHHRQSAGDGGLGFEDPSLGLGKAFANGEHVLYWWMSIVAFVALAYITNPTDASFRVHLTDLSFRLHLKRLQAAEPESSSSHTPFSAPGDYKHVHNSNGGTVCGNGTSNASAASSANGDSSALNSRSGKATAKARKETSSGSSTPSNGASHSKGNRIASQKPLDPAAGRPGINGDNGRPHILAFGNRVSISLKTPSYVRKSYALFSTVKVLPAPLPSAKGNKALTKKSLSGSGIGSTITGTPRKSSITSRKISASQSGGKGFASDASKARAKGNKSRGLVSSLTNNLSAFASTNPWVEQGGFFVGFLGYWWTIDDGTSTSGAREKARLAKAVLAVEEQTDDVEEFAESIKPDESANQDTLDDGTSSSTTESVPRQSNNVQTQASQPALESGNSSSSGSPATAAASASIGNSNSRSKYIQRLANGNAGNLSLFRAGQRRSSPTPRLAVPATSGAGGSGSARPGANRRMNSGETPPVSPLSAKDTASPAAGSSTPLTPGTASSSADAESHRQGQSRSGLLDTGVDRNLPGLPFHVDAAVRKKDPSTSSPAASDPSTTVPPGTAAEHAETIKMEDGTVFSTTSHSASAPEAEVSTVSPACALLQSQLDELRTSSSATQARLQGELEELRSKKADEDSVRIELKSRTKALEDVKRSVETSRSEAEKKLISARAQKKTVEDRVGKTKAELGKLEKREKEMHDRFSKGKKEREERLRSLREDVKQREELLAKEVEATDRLAGRVSQLELEIDERKGELAHLRDEAAQAARARLNAANAAASAAGPRGHLANASPNVVSNNHSHLHQPSSAQLGGRHPHPASTSSPNLSALYDNASSLQLSHVSGNPYGHYAGPVHDDPHRPVSPARTPPGFVSGSSGNALSNANRDAGYIHPFGSSFLEHRMQHRRLPGSGGSVATIGSAGVGTTSSINTSVIGNSANAASALYNRHLREGQAEIYGETGSDESAESSSSSILGTFAPFGPPGSPDQQTSTSRGSLPELSAHTQHSAISPGTAYAAASPPLMHVPYFDSDREQRPSSITSPTRELEDRKTVPISPVAGNTSPPAGTIGSNRYGRASGDTEAGGAGFGGLDGYSSGPLSPMTPHQASLIPSQLFDMLDEDMPLSPTPGQMLSYGDGPDDAVRRSSGEGSPSATSQQHRGMGMSGWDSLDDFAFDAPRGLSSLSRKVSNPQHVQMQMQAQAQRNAGVGSGGKGSSSPLGPALETSSNPSLASPPSDSVFSPQYTARSLASQTSSGSGSISPSLASNTMGSRNFAATGPNVIGGGALGREHDSTMMRHVLSLNPDAKAFSFNRPLPSSASFGQLRPTAPASASTWNDPTRALFEAPLSSTKHRVPSSSSTSSLDVLGNHASKTSPLPGHRGLPATSTSTTSGPGSAGVGHAHTGSSSSLTTAGPGPGHGHGQRTASGNATGGSSFSPFDDDDLLRGW